jgi:hypothetical protein
MLSQLSDLGTARLPADMTGHIETLLHVVTDDDDGCRWSFNQGVGVNFQQVRSSRNLAHYVARSSSVCSAESASATAA